MKKKGKLIVEIDPAFSPELISRLLRCYGLNPKIVGKKIEVEAPVEEVKYALRGTGCRVERG